MHASRILALFAVSLTVSLFTTAAGADETAKPAPLRKPIIVEMPPIKGFAPPQVSVDVARVTHRMPLAELRKSLVDRISATIERDPF
jgi:hypothetical protein